MKIRSKLMAATAMLLVSAVMMTTASFAWFTISTAPEIKGMAATVVSNGNLEIALDNGYDNATAIPESAAGDTGYNEKWGNLVDLSGFAAVTLKPVQYANGGFNYATYGADGRVNQTPAATSNGTGVVYYTDDTTANVAYKVDFWMRTNEAGTISLSTAADRGNGVQGGGSTMTNHGGIVNVMFVCGDSTVNAQVDDNGAMTANVVTFTEAEVTAGTAKKVSMYVFVPHTVTNKDAANTTSNMTMNIQFKHSTTLNPMSGTTQPST